MRRLSVSMIATLLVLGACGSDPPSSEPTGPSSRPVDPVEPTFGTGIATIDTGDRSISLEVEVAVTTQAQRQGLMHRTELGADRGMVFLFEDERPRSFWMKDTLIPLSIAFFDDAGTIRTILDMQPCGDLPSCPLYHSQADVSGALEVNQGWFADHRIEAGDRITVDAETP